MNKFSIQDIPAEPGVYVFRNSSGDVIYVGKAKSLRKRLATYFQPSRRQTADVKLRALINSIADYELFPVKSEAEALLLESRFIKQYSPRYNVELRDDKRFLHICVDLHEPYPRLRLTRIRKDDGRIYFGPYPRAKALRETVRYLSKYFKLRTCSPRHPDSLTRQHCMKAAFSSCCCPCLCKVSAAEYRQHLDAAIAVLKGDRHEIVAALAEQMQAQARQMQFEDAARTRDMIENLNFVCVGNRRTFRNATLDSTRREAGNVAALQEALRLRTPPNVIWCFDMSNIGGHLAVGSLVVFDNGKPNKQRYRRFRIKSPDASDDTAMIYEVVCRRFKRLVEDGESGPDLVVIDGGRGQLNAALKAMHAAGASARPALGLAKRQEEVYLPGREAALVLPRHNEGLQLLQAVRDEAHRFALDYHRLLRRRRIADSILFEIDGVGPKRREQLLKQFGSVQNLRKALPEQIAAAVPGLGMSVATSIHQFLSERM